MSSKVVLYKGKRGAGKTLTMVKDGLMYEKEGWLVLRNFQAEFGHHIKEEDVLKLDKSSPLRNCVIMLDELQIFFDARRSMAKQNLKFSNFIQQIRKRNIILLGTTQYSNTIDLRLRQHLDILVHPKFIKKYDLCEVTYIDLTTIEDGMLGEITTPNLKKIVYDAKPIYSLYNTEEILK